MKKRKSKASYYIMHVVWCLAVDVGLLLLGFSILWLNKILLSLVM